MQMIIQDKQNFLAVCLNPVWQKTITRSALVEGGVNRVKEHRLDASGKGVNLCRVLTQLGTNATLLTHLNSDEAGAFASLCKIDGITLDVVKTKAPIRHGYTLIDLHSKITTEIIEEGDAVEERCVNDVLARFRKVITRSRALLITGSKAAGYPESLYPEMVRIAKSHGCRVYCDLRGADLRTCVEAGADFIKLNLEEFNQSFAESIAGGRKAKRFTIASALAKAKAFSCTGTVITLGSSGAGGCCNGEIHHQKGKKITPVNTIGCGDAYLAGFAHSFERHGDFKAAMDFGADCAIRNALTIKPGSLL